MIRIGQNAAVLGSKASLDVFVGSKVAAFLRARRELRDAGCLLELVDDAELEGLSYTPEEVSALRLAVASGEAVDAFCKGEGAKHEKAMQTVAAVV